MKSLLKLSFPLIAVLLVAGPASAGWKCCKIKIRPPKFIPLPPIVRDILPPAIRKPIDEINKLGDKVNPVPTIVIGGSNVVEVRPNREAENNLKKVFIDPAVKVVEKNRALIEKMNRISTCLRTACLSEYLAARELAKAQKKEEQIYREFMEMEARRQNQELTEEEQHQRNQMLSDARSTWAASRAIADRADISNTLGKVFGHLLMEELQNRSLKTTAQVVSAETEQYHAQLRQLLDIPDMKAGERLEAFYAKFEGANTENHIPEMRKFLQSASDSDLNTLKELRQSHLAVVNESAAFACEDGLAALDLLESKGEKVEMSQDFRQFCNGAR